MSDLIERLRKWRSYSNGIPSHPEICTEAAAELARLTTENAALRADANVWHERRELQIDSYATNRQMIHAHIVGKTVTLEITDGSYSWRGKLPVPWCAEIDSARAKESGNG